MKCYGSDVIIREKAISWQCASHYSFKQYPQQQESYSETWVLCFQKSPRIKHSFIPTMCRVPRSITVNRTESLGKKRHMGNCSQVWQMRGQWAAHRTHKGLQSRKQRLTWVKGMAFKWIPAHKKCRTWSFHCRGFWKGQAGQIGLALPSSHRLHPAVSIHLGLLLFHFILDHYTINTKRVPKEKNLLTSVSCHWFICTNQRCVFNSWFCEGATFSLTCSPYVCIPWKKFLWGMSN